MKKLLICAIAALGGLGVTSARAADAWNWTGFYAGLNIGYSWGHSATDVSFFNNTTNVLLTTASKSFSMDGVIGGGQIGYNWQWDKWVFGLEADLQASGQKGDTTFNCPGTICNFGLTAVAATVAPVNVTTFDQKLDWFGTLRGRLGLTVTPTILAYVTGGLAVGHIETDGNMTGFTGGGLATSSTFGNSTTKTGWTIGGGLEGRLWGRWTGKIEYLYMDLGTVDTTGLLTTNFIPIRAEFSSKITDNIVRVGLNYKLN